MSADAVEVREVRILEFPLDVDARAQEQHAELMREFALLEIASPAARDDEIPQRLRTLIASLQQRYSGVSDDADMQRDAARSRGETSLDMTFQAPVPAGEACHALSALLDEADDYCRAGDQLLTLATAADLVAFRHWYLGEFTRQLRGESPQSWPDYVAEHQIVVSGSRATSSR